MSQHPARDADLRTCYSGVPYVSTLAPLETDEAAQQQGAPAMTCYFRLQMLGPSHSANQPP
eukprot:12261707-Alexandrium_andersonii.AAC.1